MSSKEKLILIGGGGHCKSIIDSLISNGKYEIIGILDANLVSGSKISNFEILGDDSKLCSLFKSGIRKCFVTIGSVGNYGVRKKVIENVKQIGFDIINIIDNSSIVSGDVKIGEGVFIGKNCIVNTETIIGNYCIINTGSIIEHECNISSFSHIAPGAVLAGNVSIGIGTHIGLNATVNQGIRIGNDCLIGSGSIVLSNVKDNTRVVGVYNEK